MPIAAKSRQQAAKFIERYFHDPVLFAEEVLGKKLIPKQKEILNGLSRIRRRSVVGANGTGKDFAVGGVVIPWWLWTRWPSKVLVLGPSHRQVNDVIWGEFRKSVRECRFRDPGTLYDTPYWRFSEEHFARGFATQTGQRGAFRIQGYHSPFLLVCVTEAHAMEQAHIDAVKRLNPRLIVMTGNPFVLAGEFYDSHHSMRDVWNPVSISAFDAIEAQKEMGPIPGLVSETEVEERKREWGEGSPLYVGAVLGEFPDSLDDSLIPLKTVMEAVERELRPGKPNVLGVDVARFGADKTVVCHRRGPVCRIVWKAQGKTTQETARWVADYFFSWNQREERKAEPDLIESVNVDAVGVGAGVADALREMDVPAFDFQGGAGAVESDRYADANSEAWAAMARAFKDGEVDIERDENLISQLATRRYMIQSDRRLKIESKESLRPKDAAGWHSPDEADALAMTFWPGGYSGWGFF